MKLYVIYKGHYSDIYVDRIFLDKTKAETYSHYHPETWISEEKTADDEWNLAPDKCYWKVDLSVDVYKFPKKGYQIREKKFDICTLQIEGSNPHGAELYHETQILKDIFDRVGYEEPVKNNFYGPNPIFTLNVVRCFPVNDGDAKFIEEKIQKICKDYCTQLENFIEETDGNISQFTLNNLLKNETKKLAKENENKTK